ADYLIPKDVHWNVVNMDGSESTSRTVFSACHEFRGEATLRFDVAPDAGQVAASKTMIVVPADAMFSLILLDPISTATAAAGDLFRAKLAAIRTKRGWISIPKDAIVTGRIVRIERQYESKSQSMVLGLRPETIQVHGVSQPFRARQDSGVGFLYFKHVTDTYVIRKGLRIEGTTAATQQ
ncbi:MAG TPA: hypothetical protein VK638_05385, partial [Edaphobacter sp.]|nr:hypothetical protein [Edaphobacter sp.]